ncbi:S-methyl-5-thioribose-1-phosphate isomerase [Halomonadaceae bacterium KBTZ08]
MTQNQVTPFRWQGEVLEVLDQRLLPAEEVWRSYSDAEGVYQAIHEMQVRGAPAIGIAAAYGVVLAARGCTQASDWYSRLGSTIDWLAQARPTAVNLVWALERMRGCLEQVADSPELVRVMETEALRIHEEDADANRAMGKLGADRILAGGEAPVRILTHCNTGALATGGQGTALGVVRELFNRDALGCVHMDETRPWLQGARLTAWECEREGMPCSLNVDGAAATLMAQGEVDWVVVGSDRITANGDVANKIGTLPLAILARHYGVGMMVVAPSSTLDSGTSSGDRIEIEERDGTELRRSGRRWLAPNSVAVFNPVFDVTPASLVDVIVTENGVCEAPGNQRAPLESLA